MSIITNKLDLAKREIGRSVIQVNHHLVNEVPSSNEKLLYYGIKDTNQIPNTVIELLRKDPNYAWLTIDKAANKGRAIDTDLINPLTYRVMTGSSSGGPINILKGFIDFAIGTDGGGSVLAPAMSCQLPAIIGAGTGIFVREKKVSTDKLEFTGSVGVIAKRISILKRVMESLLETNFPSSRREKIRIAIPKQGSVATPDGIDMYDKLKQHLSAIDSISFDIIEVAMKGIDDRAEGKKVIQACFEEHDADIILTCEGPIDVYGYGETIPMHFGGVGQEITQNHGKYLIRAANMAKTTAITIPTSSLASGLVLIAKEGIENCSMAFDLAERFEQSIKLPEVWRRYFLEQEQEFSGIDFFK